MIVKLIDITTPRSDGKPKVENITLGNEYMVAEVIGTRISIMNDKNKLTRHSMARFEIIDPTPPRSLRDEFNTLTHALRMRNKELAEQLTTCRCVL